MRVYFYVFLLFFILGGGIDCCVKQQSKKATFIWWPQALERIEEIPWYQHLQSEFSRYGYHLQTQDIHPPQGSEIVVWAYPNGDLSGVSERQYVVGWLMESPISLSQPLPQEDDKKFDVILTYRRDLVDNQRSFFVRIFTRIEEIKKEYWQTPKSVLVSQIASCYLGGQYEERKTAAKWFLENAPQDFKLYGGGWNKIKSDLDEQGQAAFDRQYGGYVEDKAQTVAQSKFVLAYENAVHNDYITEKIYDVLQAGSVPVYLGAPNILRYVPKACFINKNAFPSYEMLYTYLKNMDDRTYEAYRQCAYHFVQSESLKQSSIINQVVQHIFNNKEKDFYDWWHLIWGQIAQFFVIMRERISI